MRGRWLVALLLFVGLRVWCAAQTQTVPKADEKARARAEALKEFAGHYEGRVPSLTIRYEGEEFTARRVELPPPSLKGNTTFRLKGHAEARVVALAGSFNDWNQSQLLFGREGDEWVCRVDLDPGVYSYKFVVDGNWLLDPSNPATQEDEAGNVNNVLEVKPPE